MLVGDLNIHVKVEVHTDSSTARSLSNRLGVGTTKHMQNKWLWIQERVQHGDISIHTVGTDFNVSDPLTKGVSAVVMDKHCATCGLRFI